MKYTTLGLLAGIISISAVAISVYAYSPTESVNGEPKHGFNMARMNRGMHSDMGAVIESGDYELYVQDMTDRNVPRIMTKDQFSQAVVRHAEKESIHDAVLAGDYIQWRAQVGGDKFQDINASNFYLLSAMAQARKSGDATLMREAMAALDSAGVDRSFKETRHGRMGHGMFPGGHQSRTPAN